MADRIIKILTPATDFRLLTLDELKTMLGIQTGDTSDDAQLNQWIDWYSATVSQIANRVFARERVRETWRCGETRRAFLSHYPVWEEDIESVMVGVGIDGTGGAAAVYDLEEGSGKISLYGNYSQPIVVTYTGGYLLPDEAPDDLKNATSILIRSARASNQRDATSGIRSISHKDSRVMFFDPNSGGGRSGSASAGGTSMESIRAVHALLYHYSRLEV